jgi:hypothetical protein
MQVIHSLLHYIISTVMEGVCIQLIKASHREFQRLKVRPPFFIFLFIFIYFQYLSVLRFRDPVFFFTPGSGMEKKSSSRMNIPDHFVSESLETVFLGCKYLDSLMRIRSGDLFDPRSGMLKFCSGIRYIHPGSATLVFVLGYLTTKF